MRRLIKQWLAALTVLTSASLAYSQDAEVPDPFSAELAACAAAQDLSFASLMPSLSYPYFVNLQTYISLEARAIENTSLIIGDGEGAVDKQTSDMDTVVGQNVDGIIMSPVDSLELVPAVQRAVSAGIPVVTLDRMLQGMEGQITLVAADNLRGGEAQAEVIVSLFPQGATIFNIQGDMSEDPFIQRSQGVHNVVEGLPDRYRIVLEQPGNFLREEARRITEEGLSTAGQPNAIIAANDDMALGALDAVTARGLQGQIAIVGYDATPAALEQVRDGGLTATIEQFPSVQGRAAVRWLSLARRGCIPDAAASVLIPPLVITAENLEQAERFPELAAGEGG
jgi:ABC-type sugar transport system substrate-binding protein